MLGLMWCQTRTQWCNLLPLIMHSIINVIYIICLTAIICIYFFIIYFIIYLVKYIHLYFRSCPEGVGGSWFMYRYKLQFKSFCFPKFEVIVISLFTYWYCITVPVHWWFQKVFFTPVLNKLMNTYAATFQSGLLTIQKNAN